MAKHEDAIQSGLQEAVRLPTLRHASIVSIYDLGVEDGAPFIVMEPFDLTGLE